MDAVEVRDLRVGDAVVEADEQLIVCGLQLGVAIAHVRLMLGGDSWVRSCDPRELVLRMPREALAA